MPRTSGAGGDGVATYNDSVRASAFQLSRTFLHADDLRHLQRKSSTKGALQVVGHVALVASLGLLQYQAGALSVATGSAILAVVHYALLVLQSFCMAFLFTGFHELTHMTVFAGRLGNTAVGHAFGFAIFRPFWHYTFYHYNHHKFTGDPHRDPELQDSFIDLKLDNVVSYAAYLSAVPYWTDRLSTLLRHAVLAWVLPREEAFLTEETKRRVLQEARVYVSLYAAMALWSMLDGTVASLVWQLWLLPTIVAQPFLRFYLVAEHMGCPTGDVMLSNTRTTTTFAWYRWLAWQMPYHAEHHTFPFIPFHALPRVHALLKARPETSALYHSCDPDGRNGYLGVHVGLLRSFFGNKKQR